MGLFAPDLQKKLTLGDEEAPEVVRVGELAGGGQGGAVGGHALLRVHPQPGRATVKRCENAHL